MKKIKIMIIFLLAILSFQNNAFASERINLKESKKIDNIEFVKEEKGKLIIDGKEILNGTFYGNDIKEIGFEKTKSGIYFEICDEHHFCDRAFWHENELVELNLHIKWGGKIYIKEIEDKIFFALKFLESDDEWTVTLYDKEKQKQVGSRQFENIDDINNIEILDNNILIKNQRKVVKSIKLNSINENSIEKDREYIQKKYSEEEKKLEGENENIVNIKDNKEVEKTEKISSNNIIIISILVILILFITSLFIVKRKNT